jgi:hypothetical protein
MIVYKWSFQYISTPYQTVDVGVSARFSQTLFTADENTSTRPENSAVFPDPSYIKKERTICAVG